MKEFLGRIKADFLLSSVLFIALGLVFIIWRASVLTIVANVLAVVLIIIGAVSYTHLDVYKRQCLMCRHLKLTLFSLWRTKSA